MGTRAITVVKDEENKKIIEMYSQYDGYPDGLGQDLIDFIKSGTMVSGFSNSNEIQFNGIGCFAGQLVANFKDGVGGFYLHSPTTDFKNKTKYYNIYYAEYYYEIDSKLNIKCWDTYTGKEVPFKDGKFIEKEEE